MEKEIFLLMLSAIDLSRTANQKVWCTGSNMAGVTRQWRTVLL